MGHPSLHISTAQIIVWKILSWEKIKEPVILRNPPKPGLPINGLRNPVEQQNVTKETQNHEEKRCSNLLTVPSVQFEVLQMKSLANAYINEYHYILGSS